MAIAPLAGVERRNRGRSIKVIIKAGERRRHWERARASKTVIIKERRPEARVTKKVIIKRDHD